MGLILSLETATKVCSVSLGRDGVEVNTLGLTADQYSHSEKLNGLIVDLLEMSGVELNLLDAIAVSEGPGSYTGLRIGTSSAKGLCYALDLPLIAINSLEALAIQKKGQGVMICPMFDARRMEVYSAIYDESLTNLEPTTATVIDEHSYQEFLAKGQVCFIGPGAEKCQPTLTHQNAIFDLEVQVTAQGMIELAEAKFKANDFVNLAYFEPFYLKDFIAGAPKKMF
jgi:tRNA threonylcarbamoyladenosine biosynthesis protein TsaB